jgi:hypothetical protein
VLAQSCVSDFQCADSAAGYNVCLGDMLIMRRRICVAGQCQEQELGRIDCGAGTGAGTCRGNVFVQGAGRCDALSGRCTAGRTIEIACAKSCTCRQGTLTISTGVCSPGAGCGRTVMRCKQGCTCDPEPRCLVDPASKPRQRPKSQG